MIINGGQVQLIERAFCLWLKIHQAGEGRSGNIGEILIQYSMAKPICQAERPVPGEQLVGGELQRLFLIVQAFIKCGGGVGPGTNLVCKNPVFLIIFGIQYLAG